MIESVINGANLFFAAQFVLNTENGATNASQNQWIFGLLNGAPYVRPSYTSSASLPDDRLLALLRSHLLLAYPPAQQVVRTSRRDLHYGIHFVRELHLARRHQFMATSICRSFGSRIRYWTQIDNGPRICCGVCPSSDSWSPCYDVVCWYPFSILMICT